jgi:hypothetical protein
MPHRLDEHRAKVQFTTSARMPSLIYKACNVTGVISNTRYIQQAVCEALARDLGIPIEELLAELPPCRDQAARLFGTDRKAVRRTGPANTVEEVR